MTSAGTDTNWNVDREEGTGDAISYVPKGPAARLPIQDHRHHLLYLLERHQCLVIQGETGSGKSTQIPQFLLDAGWTRTADGHVMIAVTQPRKVAAISLAARVAEERSSDLGQEVGYAVRFDEKWDPDRTRIKFMTEGILIREMLSDPLLLKYQVR
jgi:ATP-dependent RNA helicase DDX35